MMKSNGMEASIETENVSRMPALKDVLIFAIIALAAFCINAFV